MIGQHEFFQLGKNKAREDRRTLLLSNIIIKKNLPRIPAQYDTDTSYHFGVPLPMFANDQYGDCVIAGRAHHTLRMEAYEQNLILNITDKQVVNEYFKETGGPDEGLVVLDSLNLWRRKGWRIGKRTYSIYAYGLITKQHYNLIPAAIYLLGGIGVGLSLPISASDQIDHGKPWEISQTNNEPGSWGGHYVYICGYEKKKGKTWITCVTWGRKQRMSMEFFRTYCDEAYGIIDKPDGWLGFKSPVDVDKLNSYLKQVS